MLLHSPVFIPRSFLNSLYNSIYYLYWLRKCALYITNWELPFEHRKWRPFCCSECLLPSDPN